MITAVIANSMHTPDRVNCTLVIPAARLRRTVFFLLVVASTAAAVYLMADILRSNGMTPLDLVILALFAVLFAWIDVALCTAATGFVLQLLRVDPLSLRRQVARASPDIPLVGRTAVVMPVCNEDPACVIAGLEAVYRDVITTGDAHGFHFYLLSDTTDSAIAAEEEAAWSALRRRVAHPERLFYRRREGNGGRKAGNIAEFCRRWGAHYEYMVVLDADSIMSGNALVTLARAIEQNPDAGMIQTLPIPACQQSMFGRFLQFAASLYSPMLGTGMSFWQTDTANYWGHNAIVRVRAFMAHCGLPALAGKPPLGGEILCHDFVEAALMRRGGWRVYLFPEIGGSYEGVPSNFLDYVKRDRRWAQGNLQHLRLLTAHGLHPLSRLYFLLGALGYGSSLLWLITLVLSSIDTVVRVLQLERRIVFEPPMFAGWPRAQTGEVFTLLGIVGAMLVAPKVMGVVLSLCDRQKRRRYGGAVRLVVSATLELLFSVLIAPVLMVYHAYFVSAVLLGRKVGWNPQNREGRSVGWGEAVRSTFVGTLAAVLWGAGLVYAAPLSLWPLAPVLTGLVLGAPLVAWSSRIDLGLLLQRMGLFLAPCETEPETVLRVFEHLLEQSGPYSTTDSVRRKAHDRLPPERLRTMPVQSLSAGPHWNAAASRPTEVDTAA